MIHKKLLSLLVLLMTAASGAWAQTQITQDFEDGMGDWTMNNCHDDTGITNNYGGYEGLNSYSFRFYYTSNYPQYLISPELDENDGGTMSFYYARYSPSWLETFKVGYSTTTSEPTAFTWGDEVNCTNTYTDGYLEYTYDFPAGTKYVSIACTSNDQFYLFVDAIKIEYTAAEAPTDVEVTTNAAEGETFFTEASFNMPTFDATVNYDIVRDMADTDNPVEFSGITRSVVVKQGGDNKYQPLTPLTIQLIDQLAATDAQNIIAADGIKVKVLKGTLNGTTIEYDETNTLTLEAFEADMQPGYYKIVAEPTDATTSPYTGTASLAFQTLTGYPVEVAANGFVTYYSDENLTVDDDDAQLYTITSVDQETATATEIPSANAGMPFLIFNSTDEPQTFLLIPTENEINQSVYPGFKGTLVDKTFTAVDMAATDHYVVNNAQFVWVKDPGTIAAHRSWLELTKNSAARSLNIVFGDATGLNEVSGVNEGNDGDTYDLNGRKVAKGTLRKGVYVKNGKKVVNK